MGSGRTFRERRRTRGPAQGTVADRGADDAGGDDRDAGSGGVRPSGALRAADHQPVGAAEPVGRGRGHLGRCRGERRGGVHDRGERGGADELADRASGSGVRPRRSGRAQARVGAAAGLPGPVRQPALGTGLRDRARRGPRPGCAGCSGRSWCGGCCGWPAPWCRCSRFATSFTTDPQGIADNTVTTIVAYLFAAAALLAALKVFLGFEQQPVERPARRWVMVAAGAEQSEAPERPEPARAVEPATGENPAA